MKILNKFSLTGLGLALGLLATSAFSWCSSCGCPGGCPTYNRYYGYAVTTGTVVTERRVFHNGCKTCYYPRYYRSCYRPVVGCFPRFGCNTCGFHRTCYRFGGCGL